MSQMMTDHKGRLVPVSQIKPIDLLRDDFVKKLVTCARGLNMRLAIEKQLYLSELEAFVELSAQEYSVTMGGAKGNLTLQSFDGLLKVTRQNADFLVFDERLQVAKSLVDECIREWAEGADDKIRVLVEHAFQVDKEGKVSTERVLALRRINITDARWERAMKAIADSLTVASSKTYVRFYERESQDAPWTPISLDLASVEVPHD